MCFPLVGVTGVAFYSRAEHTSSCDLKAVSALEVKEVKMMRKAVLLTEKRVKTSEWTKCVFCAVHLFQEESADDGDCTKRIVS